MLLSSTINLFKNYVFNRSGGTTSPAAQYQQLICLACGIKFTSPDNLNAHQQYYCLKRNEAEPKRCPKCRGTMDPGHQVNIHNSNINIKDIGLFKANKLIRILHIILMMT